MDNTSEHWGIAHWEFSKYIIQLLATDEEGQEMLSNFHSNCQPFIAYIQNLTHHWGTLYEDRSNDQLVQIVTCEIGRVGSEAKALTAALECFKIECSQQKNAKRTFLIENGITKAYHDSPDKLYNTEKIENIWLG